MLFRLLLPRLRLLLCLLLLVLPLPFLFIRLRLIPTFLLAVLRLFLVVAILLSPPVLILPLLVLLLMALLYAEFGSRPEIAGMLRGMGAVAAGLIIGAALKLANALKKNPLGRPAWIVFALATFVGIALLRWSLVLVLLGVGPLACLLAFYRLKP